jgi:hypothetical protein
VGRLDIAVAREPLTVDEIRRGIDVSNALRALIRRDFAVELIEGGRVVGKRLGKGRGRGTP